MNFRKINLYYWLLVIPIVRWNLPWLAYRVNVWLVAPFILAWFFFMFLEGNKPLVVPSQKVKIDNWFTTLFIFEVIYMLLPFFYSIGVSHPTWRLGTFTWKSFISQFVHLATMLFIVHWSLARGYIRELRFIGLIIVSCMILTGVAAIRGGSELIGMGSGRISMGIAVGMQMDIVQESTMADTGMAGFGGIYYAAFATPLLVFAGFSTAKTWLKVALFCSALANWITIKYGGLATPLITIVIGFLALFISLIAKQKKIVYIIGIILTIIFVIFSYKPQIASFMSGPMRTMAEVTHDFPQFSQRFLSLAEMVEGNWASYAAVRYERQQMSFNAFIHGNWLTGNIRGGLPIGAHSELLDCLGAYGLLGFAFLVMLLISYNKYLISWGYCALGRRWQALPTIYTVSWLLTSVANPNSPGSPDILVLIVCLAVSFKEFNERNPSFSK